MLKATSDLFAKSAFFKVSPLRLTSSAATLTEERLQSFRSLESDPTKHTINHLGQLYTIPLKEKSILFQHGGLPKTYETTTKTFSETCIMVREPALDIINCLNHIDYSKPPVRFVLFGKKGTGKSLTLAHILHYAHKNKFLIVHLPWLGNWMRRPKDVSNSENQEGFFDLNIDAASWLLHFKVQNAELLKNPDLKVSEAINWTKRETTPKGASWLELIEHGISRIRFASNCVNYLCQEIKTHTEQGLCKTLVAVDGFNAFFYPNTRVFAEHKRVIPPNKITVTAGFLNLSKFDWKNSAVVVTVDELVLRQEDQISHYPRYLLGKEGFEHLDPFVPIEVKSLTRKEHRSIMDYYRERKWIQPYSGQDDELYFLSGGNFYNLVQLTRPL